MVDKSDQELLHRYVYSSDPGAFTELCRRHRNLVWSVCIRRMEGRTDLAEEVFQSVFIALMNEAKTIRKGEMTGVWLFRRAYFSASQLIRQETSRKRRELRAATEKPALTEPQSDWQDIRLQLDRCINSLPDSQRAAIVLHFLEGLSLAEIAEKTGQVKSTIQARVESGLEKLRRLLTRHGCTVSAAALAGDLATKVVEAAPDGLMENVLDQAAVSAARGNPASCIKAVTLAKETGKMIFMAKLKTVAATIVIALTAITGIIGWAVTAADKPAAQAVTQPDGSIKPAGCKIVDYGADYAWTQAYLRGDPNLTKRDNTVDVDGDGDTKDEVVLYNEFSLDDPLNPTFPTWDTTATNAVFYGGMAAFFTHTTNPILGENMSNTDHAERDDLNCHFYADKSPAEKARGCGIWIWKKQDFLNSGDKFPVSFDQTSRLAVYISRYWLDWEVLRFVVQDGEQFYMSEFTSAGNNNGLGQAHILEPLKSKWAKYDPRGPFQIMFDQKNAKFEEHKFTDVRAVGWYIAKDTLSKSACWMKWNAFEVTATVNRPWKPSENLPMAKVPAGQYQGREGKTATFPEFYMSKTEISYDTWKAIHNWASSNQYAVEPGYVFDRDGDMGSMEFGGKPHDPKEPVTGITWLDAVAWCNALSEFEGKTPCYYADTDRKTVFRMVKERRYQLDKPYVPAVFVKWDADGYRLPTLAEWDYARKGEKLSTHNSWLGENSGGGTHPVGTKNPNAVGLCDLFGNVWEYCWDIPGDACAAPAETRVVVGGDFRHPNDPGTKPGSPWGDIPGRGSYNIGFRVVRYEGGGPKGVEIGRLPETVGADITGDRPIWKFRTTETIRPETQPAQPAAPILELVKIPEGSYLRSDEAKITVSPYQMSRGETSYEQWLKIYQWAIAHGYEFDHSGDMGSMKFKSLAHVPEEPVTDISWYDAVVWCNALSEFEGKIPIYYADEKKTEVYKKSFTYRLPMLLLKELIAANSGKPYPLQKPPVIQAKWEADGYRLPTRSEWEYARLAGSTSKQPGDEKIVEEQTWYGANAGQTTHPVGTKAKNAFGLHDLTGNVFEWSWSANGAVSYYDNRNPKGNCGGEGGGSGSGAHALGGSFKYMDKKVFGTWNPPGLIPWGHYPEIGFRVVRCEAGTHPAGDEPQTDKIVLDIDPAKFNPQQNACYRANLMRTGAYTTSGVSACKGVKWKFQTGGKVLSSPVVADGIVYIGSEDKNVYAINASDGQEKWKFTTKGPIHGSVAVAEGMAFFLSGDSTLYAVDAQTGELNWSRTIHKGSLLESTPAAAYGSIFAAMGPGYSSAMYGFDAKTGNSRWRYRDGFTPGELAAPAFSGGKLFFCFLANFDSVSARTERRTWSVNTANDHGSTTPAVADGVAYATGSRGVMAIDCETGKCLWTYKKETWPRDPGFSSPAIANGLIYVGSDDGKLYAIDAKTGKPKWEFKTGAAVFSSPSIANGIVYFGSSDKFVYAVDAVDGKEKWKFETGGAIISSPAVGDGVIYVGSSDGFIYALD